MQKLVLYKQTKFKLRELCAELQTICMKARIQSGALPMMLEIGRYTIPKTPSNERKSTLCQ